MQGVRPVPGWLGSSRPTFGIPTSHWLLRLVTAFVLSAHPLKASWVALIGRMARARGWLSLPMEMAWHELCYTRGGPVSSM